MKYLYETDEWKRDCAELQKRAIETGGGGSNMAEPLYFAPGPVRIPDGLPPEEVARRKKLLAELDEYMEELEKREKQAAK